MIKLKLFLKKYLPSRYIDYLRRIYHVLIQYDKKKKYSSELGYWKGRKEAEKNLQNDYYELFYTKHFDLERSFFDQRKILDIGCGPRGSLEWANMVSERVGLDPLADEYRRLGANLHKMRYVAAPAEKIPFSNGYFDAVYSFNSLDHVDNLKKSMREIVRVIKPGGLFLLLTDVNHNPTPTEPIQFSWDIVSKFTQQGMKIVEERHYEKKLEGLYQSVDANVPYDHLDESCRYGILSVKLIKHE